VKGLKMTTNPNITKDGTEVKPGQVWLDMDKRMYKRHCKVDHVEDGKAVMQHCLESGHLFHSSQSKYRVKIAINQMHQSSTGWILVKGA
jgi:hypothetical protein